jgi:GT2 family glycosyltransferase
VIQVISYLFPTHDRTEAVGRTLAQLAALPVHDAELVMVDNADHARVRYPTRLDNGICVRAFPHGANNPCAARNLGVRHAAGEWIVMLDDDSYPLDLGHLEVMRNAAPDVAAVGAEIMLPDGTHEAGGLPEVFIGCGVAIRKACYERVGGYDHAFDYYAEEYDLAAKFIQQAWRIEHDRRFRVVHHKVDRHRDMDRILHRLVRNNGWVMHRFAPESARDDVMNRMLMRYRAIAAKERATEGFEAGRNELERSLAAHPRTPLDETQWDRFTGRRHAAATLARDEHLRHAATVAVVAHGKHDDLIIDVLHALKKTIIDDPEQADAVVVGTLSPGPMLDAYGYWRQRYPRICIPWRSARWLPVQRAVRNSR